MQWLIHTLINTINPLGLADGLLDGRCAANAVKHGIQTQIPFVQIAAMGHVAAAQQPEFGKRSDSTIFRSNKRKRGGSEASKGGVWIGLRCISTIFLPFDSCLFWFLDDILVFLNLLSFVFWSVDSTFVTPLRNCFLIIIVLNFHFLRELGLGVDFI